MEINAISTDRKLLLELTGELDHQGAAQAIRELELALDAALPLHLALDLSGVTFMDSSGIGVLLNRYKQMKAGHTSFYGACPQVMRVLKVAGILGLMHQYESKEEAIYSREV